MNIVRSEWTKLRSLPSTAWSLLAAVALVVGVGVLYCGLRAARPPADPRSFDATAVSLTGVYLAQIAVGVLGVLLVTGEYATGAIRASFLAVPKRLPVLWGKAAVFGVVVVLACLPATLAAFLIGQSILSPGHLATSLGHPGTARAVVGAALYLAAVGLLGLALGGLLRHTAGAVGALFGVLFAVQIVVGFLPNAWSDHIYRYLPGPAGLAVSTVQPDPMSLRPWSGFGLFCLYVVAVLVPAAARMRGRDA